MTTPNEFDQSIIDTSDRTDLLVWWTSEEECEAIHHQFPMWQWQLPYTVPTYIRSEYQSRLGRNGRGRLWVAEEIGEVGIPWDETKPASRLAGTRGGIVIWKSDAEHVFALPGFLTDLRLNFINEIEEPCP